MSESPFIGAAGYEPAEWLGAGDVRLPARFGDAADEYRAARDGVGLFDRSDRGLIIATGADRKAWLHNLVTNAVQALGADAGVYAFAIDVRGRTQFDLNILDATNALWLDIAREYVARAAAHLERYLISEDVALRDASDEMARLGCSGPAAGELAAKLGAGSLAEMSMLGVVPLVAGGRLFRHDFAGLPGFELIVTRDQAAGWWTRLAELGARPTGQRALDVLRIEAGIPWLGRDIDETTIPPETGQAQRGVSYHKGCYVGQEVLERMRSHGALARRLVKLRVEAPEGLGGVAPPTPLTQAGREVGRITSLVRHPVTGVWVGLGYLRTKVTDLSGLTAGDPPVPVLAS